jgi:hypothetical protein
MNPHLYFLFALFGGFALLVRVASFWGNKAFRRQLMRITSAHQAGSSNRPQTSITIERDGDLLWIRSFVVFIDGKKVGDISPDEVKHFRVDSGKHFVQVRLDWFRSKKVFVQVNPDVPCRIQCGIRKSISQAKAPSMSFLLLHPTKILYLQPILIEVIQKVEDEKGLIPLTLGFANFSGDDFIDFLADDLAALSPLFKNVNLAPVNKIPSSEILFVYAHLSEDGTLIGSANSAGLRQIVQLTNAKIVVLASPNIVNSIQSSMLLPGPKSANLIFTINRNGEGFSRFFRELFDKMREEKTMLSAWLELAPQHISAMPTYAPETLFLSEAGNIKFPAAIKD